MKLYGAAMLAAVGCGAAIPPVPSQGGPPWRELTSEHFTVWTDGSREAGDALIQRMEDLRHAVIGIGFRAAAGPGRVFVLALRDRYEVSAYVGEGVGAVAVTSRGSLYQPFILLPVETATQRQFEVAAHELTHSISHLVIARQPRWFAEGLAEYFETIVIDHAGGTVELGRAPTYQGRPVRQERPYTFTTLFGCGRTTQCEGSRFYSTAWALVTFLMNKHPGAFAAYEQSLIDTDGNHDQAWLDAFGTGSLDSLFMDLRMWLQSGSHQVLRFNATFRTWPIAERPLGDADVHAARALMRLQFVGTDEQVKAELAGALALERTHVLAQLVAFRLDEKKPLDRELARATTTAHPDDWRAWFLLATALGAGDEADAARAKVCELVAVNPAIVSPVTCPVR